MLYDSFIQAYLCDFFAEEVKHGCRPIINNVWFSGKASPVQCRGGHCLGMGVKVGAQKIHNPKECVDGRLGRNFDTKEYVGNLVTIVQPFSWP